MYQKAQGKIEKEHNIVKITNGLRDLHILMENSLLSKRISY